MILNLLDIVELVMNDSCRCIQISINLMNNE